jgi:tetratricopeptide (TPR) repeat protein
MMKKIALLFLVVLALSCGVKENPPDITPPVASDILNEAWDKYDEGDFSTALTLFDSAITLDAFYEEAYFGKAWTATQLSKFEDAASAYSFTLILYSLKQGINRFDVPMFNETFAETDTNRWGIDSMIGGEAIWHVKVANTPLLCYSSIKIKKGQKYVEPEYFDISDSLIFLKDTLYPNTADTLVDTFFLNYYYLDSPTTPTVPENIYLSYTGLVGTYVANEDFLSAIIAGNVLRNLADTSLKFTHYPYTDYTRSIALLAYAAYKINFMNFCVQVIVELDPSWVPPSDPFDPDAKVHILEKINQYLGG